MLLVLAVVVYVGVTVIRGVRWHVILRRVEVPASMADAQALVVVGYMGNTVLPARGGELLRVFLMGRQTSSSRVTILGTIVAERLLDIVALFMLLLLALATASAVSGSSQLGLPAAILLAVLALALLASGRINGGRRLRNLRIRIAPLTRASRDMLSARGALLVLLTAVVWIGEGCIYWLVGRALALHLDLLQGCSLVVLSSLAASIPAAPGYAGTYDAAIQVGLHALHVHGGPAVAFGLLVRLILFVPITAAGLILVVLRYGGLGVLKRVRGAGTTTPLGPPRTGQSMMDPAAAGRPAASVPAQAAIADSPPLLHQMMSSAESSCTR